MLLKQIYIFYYIKWHSNNLLSTKWLFNIWIKSKERERNISPNIKATSGNGGEEIFFFFILRLEEKEDEIEGSIIGLIWNGSCNNSLNLIIEDIFAQKQNIIIINFEYL